MKLEMYYLGLCLAVMWLVSWPAVLAQDDPVGSCGVNHHNRQCTDGNCCSNAGYCGSTNGYCCPENCQSQCPTPTPTPPPGPEDDVSNIITREIFTDMFPHGPTSMDCEGCLYTYDAFITAARVFPAFGATGTPEIRRRELAAFFGQTSHETTGGGGGWDPPGGPYLWGYCFVREIARGDYCVPSQEWPCVPGQQYYGRGPIQLSYNYNYGPAGLYLGVDLLSNPDLVATNATLSFETAIWFWMTQRDNKPSCHDVITGAWTPTQADKDANRLPGYGVLTNIINGGLECGIGPDTRVQDRIGFYKRYSEMFETTTGDNLDCDNQRHFGSTLNNPYPNSHYGVLKMPIDQA